MYEFMYETPFDLVRIGLAEALGGLPEDSLWPSAASLGPPIRTVAVLLLSLGGLWALLIYRRSKRLEAGRWMYDNFLRFQLAPELDRAKLIFEFHYRDLVEPIHAVLVAGGRSALDPDKQTDSQHIDRLLTYLEHTVSVADAGHAQRSDCLAYFKRWFDLLSDPERGALRRYLVKFGYERLARIAGAGPDDFLLLYGSLGSRESMHAQLGLAKALEPLGVREIPGILYDLGEYPGLVLGAGSASAELFKVKDLSVLRRLDEFEEFDHARLDRSLFRRTTLQLPRHTRALAHRLRGRPMIDAWIYVYNQPIDGQSKIEARSWHDHKRQRREPDFSYRW